MLSLLYNFRRVTSNNRANVAVTFALTAGLLILAVAGVIDFSLAIDARQKMQDAVDEATIGSIAANSMIYKQAAYNNTIDEAAAERKIRELFFITIPKTDNLEQLKIESIVKKNGNTINAQSSVSGNYRTILLSLAGIDHIPLNASASAVSTIPPFIDFYLLLDNTPSMGVGATNADILTMVSHTSDKCAFACHQADAPGRDYYARAKSLGVNMRIDVVRSATQSLMKTAQSTNSFDRQFRMAIYDFGRSADTIDSQNPGAYQVSALTANLTQSASDAGSIDLMVMPYAGYNSDRQTNFASVLSDMNRRIPTPGDGSSATAPQKVLFLVTDGATDSYDCAYKNGNSCRRISPLDAGDCQKLKARDIRIAVLYTTYLPLPTNSFYNTYMAKYVSPPSQLATAMQNCASPGLYFEVSPSQGISDAMNSLFKKVVSTVRLIR